MKLVTLFLLLCVCLLTISATSQKPQWEYKFVYRCDDKNINATAVDGWELSAMSTASYGSIGVATCVFKRPK